MFLNAEPITMPRKIYRRNECYELSHMAALDENMKSSSIRGRCNMAAMNINNIKGSSSPIRGRCNMAFDDDLKDEIYTVSKQKWLTINEQKGLGPKNNERRNHGDSKNYLFMTQKGSGYTVTEKDIDQLSKNAIDNRFIQKCLGSICTGCCNLGPNCKKFEYEKVEIEPVKITLAELSKQCDQDYVNTFLQIFEL